MFTVYYSNDLNALASMFIQHQKISPNSDPFTEETILVQSVGMAQWLQMEIAEQTGIAGNYNFPFPTSFIWQQYRLVFPYLPKENIFERAMMAWRLMRIIPNVLEQEDFSALRAYLKSEKEGSDLRLYQLANKIADLFDQYLVYRPHWLVSWEKNNQQLVINEIKHHFSNKIRNEEDIAENVLWQSILWNLLIEDTKKDYDELLFTTSHRAYLQNLYFEKLDNLTEEEQQRLPKRIFVFGISSLPPSQLSVLRKLSEHCDIHLFFLNPSEKYWGDSIEDSVLEKLALKQQLSQEDIDALLAQQGNQLLAIWGKQGRDFLAQLVEEEHDVIEGFIPPFETHNLSQIKQAILEYHNEPDLDFKQDHSIQIHSAHSILREVEILHNQLLHIFEQNKTLSAKDIIVMSPNIEQYAPYIQAVFSRYDKKDEKGVRDKRYIPFTISDKKISEVDPILSSFISLLSMKESRFSAEEILDLLEVKAISEKFNLRENDIVLLRNWIKASGIRAELTIQKDEQWDNYNSWENGLSRLLLGTSLKEESGIWQNTIAFNESYGLISEQVGYLADFIEKLTAWANFLQESHTIDKWKEMLEYIVNHFYQENETTTNALLLIFEEIEKCYSLIEQTKYNQPISIDIISSIFKEKLNCQKSHLQFLAGKVNFCTLLPMRAIPFKVVCLLGMNEADFPRQQQINSFDLMQYHPQKGDRARRDDDRYLFLEALLSAQDIFYMSYIGQSLVNNKEYFPSVLVSQLMDYLIEYSDLEEKAQLIQNHPITVFSPNNFKDNYLSYDKEWLPLVQNSNGVKEFISEQIINEVELPKYIELDDLISFIQSPARYFFTRQLGVNFSSSEESIEETEHFSLSRLDEYTLLDELLNIKNEEIENFFEKEDLKGNSLVLNFGKLKKEELNSRIENMRSELAGYLNQDSQVLEINVTLDQTELVGNIQHQFGNDIVLWRTGALRDKDTIKLWIYYLVSILSGKENSPVFYYLNNEALAQLSFNKIEKEQAKAQLEIYVSAYLRSFITLELAITSSLDNYFDNISENIEKNCENKLIEIAESYNDENIYLRRILNQSEKLDYAHIHQTTLDWFDLMKKSKNKG